jgi:hypothetical protein
MEEGDSVNIPCSVCKVKIAIYRCPACFARTCSLACCLKHKEKSGCDGKRNRVGFVPLHKYNDSTLSNDYHFLEDVLAKSERGKRIIKDMGAALKEPSQNKRRKTGNNKKNKGNDQNNIESEDPSTSIPIQPLLRLQMDGGKSQSVRIEKEGKINPVEVISEDSCSVKASSVTKTNPMLKEKSNNSASIRIVKLSAEEEKILAKYPPHKQRLVRQAQQRDISLLLMAPGMQRHVMNKSTKYDTKKDLINWKVEFIIHSFESRDDNDNINENRINTNGKNDKSTKITLTSDRIPEIDPISNHLSTLFERNISHIAPSLTRSVLLNFSNSSNTKIINDNVRALMKRIPCKSSQPSYRRVNLNNSLKDILRGTTVIEFPTIELVLEDDLNHFPVFIEEIK